MEALLLLGIENKTQLEIDDAIDKLARKDRPLGKPEEWRLFQLIKVAEKLHIIKELSAKQCDLARDYRNLVHPGKVRTHQPCDRATALGALAGCEIVVRELS